MFLTSELHDTGQLEASAPLRLGDHMGTTFVLVHETVLAQTEIAPFQIRNRDNFPAVGCLPTTTPWSGSSTPIDHNCVRDEGEITVAVHLFVPRSP